MNNKQWAVGSGQWAVNSADWGAGYLSSIQLINPEL